MAYELSVRYDPEQYGAAHLSSSDDGAQTRAPIAIALLEHDYDELLLQTSYPVMHLCLEDRGDPNREVRDVRQYTDRHGTGDWDQLASHLSGARFGLLVPRPLSLDRKAMKAVNTTAEVLRAYGARVRVNVLEPGVQAASYATELERLDALLTGNDLTGDPDDGGTLDAGDPNRETLQDLIIERVLDENRERQTLFLSSATLVKVFDGKLLPVDSTPKFSTWCRQNGVRFHKTDDTGERHRVLIPSDVAASCWSSPDVWEGEMLPLRSISRLPFVHQDGSFIDKYGYDLETQAFIADESVAEFEPLVPEHPTQEDARKAAAWLKAEVLVDFPFITGADEDNSLGLMLTALTRYIHNRPMPLFGVTAPDPATGKGLLTDVLSYILQGDGPDLKVLSDSNEEQRKVITGVLMGSANPVIVWDNIPTGSQLSSPVLCALHTTPTWSDRVLGTNSSVTLANDRVWIATGNNIGPAEDLVRRWVRIKLDAGRPHPEQRTGFRHKALKDWVLEHRTECVVALLTMIRAWDRAGRPHPTDPRTPVMGDYQPIINTVGGILSFSGCGGFWMNQAEVQEKAAEGSVEEIAEEFLHWLYSSLDTFGFDRGGFSAKQIGKLVEELDGSLASAGTSTVPLPPTVAANLGKGGSAFSVSMGRWMGEVEGRRFGSEKFRLRRLKDRKIDRGAAWALDVEPGASIAMHDLLERHLVQNGQLQRNWAGQVQ